MRYEPSLKQKFNGQKTFRLLLKTDFETVLLTIEDLGFQSGWKKLTKIPKHGNYNPNWKDCLRFVGKCIELDLIDLFPCPELPVMKGLNDLRSSYSNRSYWFLMLEVCKVYQYLARRNTRCKRDGWLKYLFNNGLIKPFNNQYSNLLEIVCNLFSDTRVEKAAL